MIFFLKSVSQKYNQKITPAAQNCTTLKPVDSRKYKISERFCSHTLISQDCLTTIVEYSKRLHPMLLGSLGNAMTSSVSDLKKRKVYTIYIRSRVIGQIKIGIGLTINRNIQYFTGKINQIWNANGPFTPTGLYFVWLVYIDYDRI